MKRTLTSALIVTLLGGAAFAANTPVGDGVVPTRDRELDVVGFSTEGQLNKVDPSAVLYSEDRARTDATELNEYVFSADQSTVSNDGVGSRYR